MFTTFDNLPGEILDSLLLETALIHPPEPQFLHSPLLALARSSRSLYNAYKTSESKLIPIAFAAAIRGNAEIESKALELAKEELRIERLYSEELKAQSGEEQSQGESASEKKPADRSHQEGASVKEPARRRESIEITISKQDENTALVLRALQNHALLVRLSRFFLATYLMTHASQQYNMHLTRTYIHPGFEDRYPSPDCIPPPITNPQTWLAYTYELPFGRKFRIPPTVPPGPNPPPESWQLITSRFLDMQMDLLAEQLAESYTMYIPEKFVRVNIQNDALDIRNASRGKKGLKFLGWLFGVWRWGEGSWDEEWEGEDVREERVGGFREWFERMKGERVGRLGEWNENRGEGVEVRVKRVEGFREWLEERERCSEVLRWNRL